MALARPQLRRLRQRFRSALSRVRRFGLRLRRHEAEVEVEVEVEPFSANYSRWLARQSHRAVPAWLSGATQVERTCKVAVVFHVYFVELVDEFLDQLAHIPVDLDLVVTNSSGKPVAIAADRLPHAKTIAVVDSPNRGRDILPFVSVVNAGLLDSAELILKVHTKKSSWRDSREDFAGSGEDWKAGFLGDLLGSTDNVIQILSTFAEDPSLGVVTSTGSVLGTEYWGGDEAITRSLLRRLGRELDATTLRFPAGSMYWVNPAVLGELKKLKLDSDDFEPEAGQIDGTTAHAIERSVGLLAAGLGLAVEDRTTMPQPRNTSAWREYASS